MGGLNRGLGKSSLSLCQAEKHNNGTDDKEILYMSNLLSFFWCLCFFYVLVVIIKKLPLSLWHLSLLNFPFS